jgi:hypothetical protein
LKSQKIKALRALLLLVHQILEFSADPGPLGVDFLERIPKGKKAARAVQDVDVSQGIEKILVFMLAINVNEFFSQLFEHVQSDDIPIEEDPGFTRTMDEAPDQQPLRLFQTQVLQEGRIFSILQVEVGFHGNFVLAGPDHLRGGPAPQEEVYSIDQYGFTRPRLSREGVQPGAKLGMELVDNGKIFDG